MTMNELLQSTAPLWAEAAMSTCFEDATLPLLFATDDDFSAYFAAMERTHPRRCRQINATRSANNRARAALATRDFDAAIASLADACVIRRQMFPAGDYQVVAAELHLVHAAQHFAVLAIAAGELDVAHTHFSIASEKLHELLSSDGVAELTHPRRRGDPAAAVGRAHVRQVRLRLELLIHHNWADFWARRGKWSAALQHAQRAALVAQCLAVEAFDDTAAATPAAGAMRDLVYLLRARALVCLCRAPQPGVKHRQRLEALLHDIGDARHRGLTANRQEAEATFTIPALPRGKVTRFGPLEPWGLLAQSPMELSVALVSPMPKYHADWPAGPLAELLSVVAISYDCVRTRSFPLARKWSTAADALLRGRPSNPRWLKIVGEHIEFTRVGQRNDVAAVLSLPKTETRSREGIEAVRLIRRLVEGRRARETRERAERVWERRAIIEDPKGDLEEMDPAERREIFRLPKRPAEVAMAADGYEATADLLNAEPRDWRRRPDTPAGPAAAAAKLLTRRAATPSSPTADVNRKPHRRSGSASSASAHQASASATGPSPATPGDAAANHAASPLDCGDAPGVAAAERRPVVPEPVDDDDHSGGQAHGSSSIVEVADAEDDLAAAEPTAGLPETMHAEARAVAKIDARALRRRQGELRATLPSLDPRAAVYREAVRELSRNEAQLRRRRDHLGRAQLERRARAIAERIGASRTWAELARQRARLRATSPSSASPEGATTGGPGAGQDPEADMEPVASVDEGAVEDAAGKADMTAAAPVVGDDLAGSGEPASTAGAPPSAADAPGDDSPPADGPMAAPEAVDATMAAALPDVPKACTDADEGGTGAEAAGSRTPSRPATPLDGASGAADPEPPTEVPRAASPPDELAGGDGCVGES